MAAELNHIDDQRSALGFALGCVVAAYRQRLGLVAALLLSARLVTALAASGFGLVHIALPWSNLDLKLKLMSNPGFAGCGTHCIGWISTVNSFPLSHWLWQQMAMGVFGALHLMAVVMFAPGDTSRLLVLSGLIAGLAVTLPFMGSGGMTFPAIYVMLIAMLVGMGYGLTKLQKWDLAQRRMT